MRVWLYRLSPSSAFIWLGRQMGRQELENYANWSSAEAGLPARHEVSLRVEASAQSFALGFPLCFEPSACGGMSAMRLSFLSSASTSINRAPSRVISLV